MYSGHNTHEIFKKLLKNHSYLVINTCYSYRITYMNRVLNKLKILHYDGNTECFVKIITKLNYMKNNVIMRFKNIRMTTYDRSLYTSLINDINKYFITITNMYITQMVIPISYFD